MNGWAWSSVSCFYHNILLYNLVRNFDFDMFWGNNVS